MLEIIVNFRNVESEASKHVRVRSSKEGGGENPIPADLDHGKL